MSNVEKGMIIAFFVTISVISTVSSLVGRPWSTVKSFLHRYHKRGTVDNLPRTDRPEILTKRDKRTILRAVQKNREYTRESARSMLSMFLFALSIAPQTHHKEMASKEATKVDGGSCKSTSLVGADSQGITPY